MMNNVHKKIKWISSDGRFRLAARPEIDPMGWSFEITGLEMDAVHEWCLANNCGRRTSFDTFQFKNKAQMIMFLLKWG